MRKNDKEYSFWEKTVDKLDLPGQVVAGLPYVTLTGNHRLYIENHKGILEYGEEAININCGKMIIKIKGQKLELRAMSENELVITGNIASIEL